MSSPGNSPPVPAPVSWRYERKSIFYEVPLADLEQRVRLHPAFFRQKYPPRYINSLYFDTPGFHHYHAAVNGACDRLKVRLRWYGPFLGAIPKTTLEIKIKKGLMGTKKNLPLGPFEMKERFPRPAFEDFFRPARKHPEIGALVQGAEPVYLGRYYRKYYETPDGNFRLTFDADLAYHQVIRGSTDFRIRSVPNFRPEIIMEFKYPLDQAPAAERISQLLPFRVDRNSKYVEGVSRFY